VKGAGDGEFDSDQGAGSDMSDASAESFADSGAQVQTELDGDERLHGDRDDDFTDATCRLPPRT
jgi:hypothetical protein